ncbi:MAG: signal peptidase I [Sporichthyaceae bacterium]
MTLLQPGPVLADVAVEAPVDSAPRRSRRARRPVSRMYRARRIVSGILLAAVTLACVVAAVFVVVLRVGFSPVLSESMEPVFGPGDLVLTRPIPASEVAVGDVLILPIPSSDGKATGERYTHRVTAVTSKNGLPVVTTKGDNNPVVDPWTLRIDSAKVPKVVADVPQLGQLSLLARGTGLRVVLLIVVTGFALVGIKRSILDR